MTFEFAILNSRYGYLRKILKERISLAGGLLLFLLVFLVYSSDANCCLSVAMKSMFSCGVFASSG